MARDLQLHRPLEGTGQAVGQGLVTFAGLAVMALAAYRSVCAVLDREPVTPVGG